MVKSKQLIDKLKKSTNKETTSFRIDGELLKRFRDVCVKNNVNQGDIIEELLRDFLEDLKK